MRGKGKKPKISCKERQAYLLQRWGAKKVRGIEFDFTYEEWLAWWKRNLGPDWFNLRGRHSGQYVMARYRDEGPYAPWNVKCITMRQNCREATAGKNRGNAKLTKAEVTIIYLRLKASPRGAIAALVKEFDVCNATIRDIKNKMTWEHVTDLLD